MPATKSLQNPTLQKILERAAAANLSKKATSFITRTAEKVLGGLNHPDKVGEQELLILLRTGLNADDEEKARVHHRTPGEANWGEEALVFVENY